MTSKMLTIGKDGLRARRIDRGTARNGCRDRTTGARVPATRAMAGTTTGVELTFTEIFWPIRTLSLMAKICDLLTGARDVSLRTR